MGKAIAKKSKVDYLIAQLLSLRAEVLRPSFGQLALPPDGRGGV